MAVVKGDNYVACNPLQGNVQVLYTADLVIVCYLPALTKTRRILTKCCLDYLKLPFSLRHFDEIADRCGTRPRLEVVIGFR